MPSLPGMGRTHKHKAHGAGHAAADKTGPLASDDAPPAAAAAHAASKGAPLAAPAFPAQPRGARAPAGDEVAAAPPPAGGAAAGGSAAGGPARGGGAEGAGAAAGPEGPLDMGTFLDEEALLRASAFPIAPEDLIAKAKDITARGVHKCQDDLADDFVFSAPFIGPLDKKAFSSTMEGLGLEAAFPDMQPRIYHVRVDPLEPGRVWMMTRPVGRHLGYLRACPLAPVPPSGKLVELPPQTTSLVFNEQGKVAAFTMGYVMDRRAGNSGGMGGAFGLLWAIGLPFPYPEGRPWQSSLQQQLFNSGSAAAKAAAFAADRVAGALLPGWIYTAHARSTA